MLFFIYDIYSASFLQFRFIYNIIQIFLADINIDLAFVAPSGLSLKDGFTSGNYSECELKHTIVEKARRVIVLMDKSKLNRCLPFTFCKLENVHAIVTDDYLPEDITSAAKECGIDIIVAR